MTTINIGLNRRRPGSKRKRDIEHKNVQGIVIDLPWGVPGFSTRVLDWAQDNHPGWMVSGYCQVKDK